MSDLDLAAWAAPLRQRIDAVLLGRFTDAHPARLGEACRYPIQTGGKRMRPLLALAAHEALGAPLTAEAVQAAAAVELIHSYSLVHDDLPALDDDDERRGEPTVHRVYGEDGGILVGDALLTEAFGLLGDLPPAPVRPPGRRAGPRRRSPRHDRRSGPGRGDGRGSDRPGRADPAAPGQDRGAHPLRGALRRGDRRGDPGTARGADPLW